MSRPADRVSRSDIESAVRDLVGGVEDRVDASKPTIIRAGVAVGVVLLVIAYLLGRRKGRRKTTVVEIRRV